MRGRGRPSGSLLTLAARSRRAAPPRGWARRAGGGPLGKRPRTECVLWFEVPAVRLCIGREAGTWQEGTVVLVMLRWTADTQRRNREMHAQSAVACWSLAEAWRAIKRFSQWVRRRERRACHGLWGPGCRLLSSLQLCLLTWLPSPKEVAVISSLLERPYLLCIRVPSTKEKTVGSGRKRQGLAVRWPCAQRGFPHGGDP